MGWPGAIAFTRPFRVGPVPIQQWDVANLAFVPATAAVIILRFTRVSREQARSAAGLNAAREIQQRLVPVALPQFANCCMEVAYLSAQEVGGDFYRVIDQQDGSILIFIGDVSGKGLRAAMTGPSPLEPCKLLPQQRPTVSYCSKRSTVRSASPVTAVYYLISSLPSRRKVCSP